jgi:hypothetical protein
MLKRLLASTALALTAAAEAQEGAPAAPVAVAAGTTSYDQASFARYAPANALDMVRRVPGFSLDDGEDRRGFSGARGNVLIDGEPPSSKSQDLSNLLARIPAAQVVRIELRRGAAAAGDAGAPSTVVNIVRAPSGGSGVWEADIERTERNRISPRATLSWTGRRGQLDYALSGRSFREYRPLSGLREINDGVGTLVQTRADESPRTFRLHSFSAEAALPALGGRLSANGQFEHRAFAASVNSSGFTPAGDPDGRFDFFQRERNDVAELGLNFSRDVGGVGLELIGLATQDAYADNQATLLFDAAGAATGEEALTTRNTATELVGRGVLSWPVGERHRLQFGGEAAFNQLDASNFGTADLDGANTLVEETRSEAFLTDVWRPAPDWTIEATAAFERSTLTQTGDAELKTKLSFVKPSLQITRSFGRSQARLRLYRDVGQLDFDDFVTNASLADGQVTGGNPNLRPQTSWRIEAAADMRFGQDTALSITLFHWEIEDVADVLALPNDPPGNIGKGVRDGVTLTGALPLTAVLPGARLTFDATLQRGEVTDPVTGQPRTITDMRKTDIEAEFRQDLPESRFAWGVLYFKESENLTFRLNEVDTFEEGPFVDVYAESTAIHGLKIRLTAANVLNPTFSRERLFFAPDRTGPVLRREQREREFGSFLWLTISGTL